jgi:hypothetical protein
VRTLFILLILANGAFLVLAGGFAGRYLPDGREPERMSQQIAPEKIRVLPPEGPAPIATTSTSGSTRVLACIEFGGFSADEARRVETQLDQSGMTARLSVRKSEEQASYIVYLPPFPNRNAAEGAAAELRRIGVTDFFIIQDAGPFKLAISLGNFRNEDAAKAELTTLSQLGVKNAKAGERSVTVPKTYYQVRNVDRELLGKIAELHTQYPNSDIHDCPVAPAPSSSGT